MQTIIFLFVTLQALSFVSQSHQECPDIAAPEHGRITIDKNFYYIVCDHGYIAHGNPTVYCKNNEWDSPPPTCVGTSACEKPSAPENGTVNCDIGHLIIGSACYFSCNAGYKLNGLRYRRCMHDFQWSGLAPRCIPESSTFCQLPPPLKHGTVVGCSSLRLPKVSEKCSFRCNKGYVLNGPVTLTCKSTGRFVDGNGQENFPYCEEITSLDQSRGSEKIQTIEKYKSEAETPGPCFNHQCEQLCKIENGQAQCRCKRGYLLNQEDQKSCKRNTGKPIYPSNPCDIENGGCEHLCSLTHNREVFCSCRAGYIRSGNDLKSCKKKSQLVSPTAATCKLNNGGCEHICTPYLNTVICSCHTGYRLSPDQKHCDETVWRSIPREPSTCEINNGGCEHWCRNKGTSIDCYCKSGYRLHSDKKHCIDVDECVIEYMNNCQHYCINTNGSYTCSCRPGFILMDGHKCEGCNKNSYWSSELKECIECPINSHTDSDGKTSIHDCVCNPGFTGKPAHDIIGCEDIDECYTNNFGCSHFCTNIPGNAYCTCPIGFMLDNDNKTCIDINECNIKNGGCEGVCHNTHGSFRCSCPEYFSLSNRDHYSCGDIDECLIDNGGCEQKCINFLGGYYCACENGYRLDRGLKNCTVVHCSSLPESPHSHMKCEKKKESLLGIEEYPIGTKCVFTCDKGFKHVKSGNSMECQEDGTWKGNLPVCKAQACDPLRVPENGAVHPSFCSKRGNKVKQKCTFTCNPGYKLEGDFTTVCKNNLSWSSEVPICEREKTHPRIECPQDITETLLPGKNSYNVTLQVPKTNMENYKIHPEWVSVGLLTEFPAGITKVTFSATSMNTNKTARCVVMVTILDKEPPVFEFCPDPIKIEGTGADGELITWEKPVVTDNVEVESVFSVSEHNTTFTPGTYIVEYIARDTSGNAATCSFNISVIRNNCNDLINPTHGIANCMDWMFGKLCQPVCEVGYMRNPEDHQYYYCDDSGVWEPNDIISDCLKFMPATSPTCPDEFELKTDINTGEDVCIECSLGTKWSETTRKCE